MSSRTRKPSGRPERRQVLSNETDLRRRPSGSRDERASFLILCEGLTEKGYFTTMRKRGGPQIDAIAPNGDHLSILREAVRRRSDEPDYDAVWCVLDTELSSELTSCLVVEAKGGNIELALSTPCFETWLILHHVDHTAPFQSAEKAKKKLKNMLPGWREAATRFTDFQEGVADACRRAQRLDPTGEDHLKNPSTSVWRLVEKLTTPTNPPALP
jgi:hypothetical protein